MIFFPHQMTLPDCFVFRCLQQCIYFSVYIVMFVVNDIFLNFIPDGVAVFGKLLLRECLLL